MEIKTAEIVEKKRETSTETTMREKLGISCCVMLRIQAFGFPWGGMMMLDEKKAHTIKIPNPTSEKKKRYFATLK